MKGFIGHGNTSFYLMKSKTVHDDGYNIILIKEYLFK